MKSNSRNTVDDLSRRVDQLERQIRLLSQPAMGSDHHTVAAFAQRIDRTPYTVREWCRLGRLQATRKSTGCGPYREWVISAEELRRYQREGLLPSSDRAPRRNP